MKIDSSIYKTKTAPVLSLQRELIIFVFIADSHQFVRSKDVADQFVLGGATANGDLNTLKEHEYIHCNSALKKFNNGRSYKRTAELFFSTTELVALLPSVLQNLTQHAKPIAHLGLLEDNNAIPVTVALTEDVTIAIHQTVEALEYTDCRVTGKAIFSHLTSMGKKIRLVFTAFKKNTLNTIICEFALAGQLPDVITTDPVFDDRESRVVVQHTAALTFAKSGYPIASIGTPRFASTIGTEPSSTAVLQAA